MKDSIYVSKENYLKAILEAEAEGRQVIPAILAHWLEVSAPAVTMALKRLKRDGLVEVGADGIVRLTAAGRETAYRTALRHHLIERMLSEVFGMEWHEVHDEAERLEHAVSPAFEIKLKEKLGEGGACPHGNAMLPESQRLTAKSRELKAERQSLLLSLHPDFGLDRKPWPEFVVGVFLGQIGEVDAHGNALHHLHVISGGVLRRQQAEDRACATAQVCHMAFPCATVGVHFDLHRIAGAHVG